MYQIIVTIIYMFCLAVAMYATSCIKFEKFCDIRKPEKVQLLWLVISLCVAYLLGNFLMVLMNIK